LILGFNGFIGACLLKKKETFINIGIFLAVIVLAVVLYFRWDNLMAIFSASAESSPEDAAIEMAEATTTVEPEPEEMPKVLAEDFALLNLDGETVNLSDFRGKSVLINFWAIWCPPCRNELPLIQEYADLFEDELVVLAINTAEDRTNVFHFAQEFDYDLTFLLDTSGEVATKYRVRGLPTSYFIDADGFISGVYIGELSESLIATYLAEMGLSK